MHSQLILAVCLILTEMKSRRAHYHKQILSLTLAFVLTASWMIIGGGGGSIMPVMTMTQQQVFAQTVDGETSQNGDGQQQPAANATTGGEARTIAMMPTEEVNGTYRWSVDNNINPTITLVANVNNTITVDNPTDDEHELVIAMTQGGEEEEVAATPEVEPNGHGELSIMPNATDSLRYYCEYHPETMLGDIRITNATTTTGAMTNQTQ
jgi:hypothetical protein